MNSLEIYGPESLIAEEGVKTSVEGEEYLHKVAVSKIIRDKLLIQHQSHCEKFRSLGPDAFKEFIDFVLGEFRSDLLTPVVDNEGRTGFDFEWIGPAFFYTFSMTNSGNRFDLLFEPISFNIDVLKTEDGWAEVIRSLSHEDSRGKLRFRSKIEEFDPNKIRSMFVCGVLEAIKYESPVLVEIIKGRWEETCVGKTRSVLLVSDSKTDDSLDLLVGVDSLYPQEVVEVFKSRYFPKIFRGKDSYGKSPVNFETTIEIGKGLDLVSLVRAQLSAGKHERIFIDSRDLRD